METKLNRKTKKKVPKGVDVFKKMLKDKRDISKHLKSGGTFEGLKEKGYRFATI